VDGTSLAHAVSRKVGPCDDVHLGLPDNRPTQFQNGELGGNSSGATAKNGSQNLRSHRAVGILDAPTAESKACRHAVRDSAKAIQEATRRWIRTQRVPESTADDGCHDRKRRRRPVQGERPLASAPAKDRSQPKAKAEEGGAGGASDVSPAAPSPRGANRSNILQAHAEISWLHARQNEIAELFAGRAPFMIPRMDRSGLGRLRKNSRRDSRPRHSERSSPYVLSTDRPSH